TRDPAEDTEHPAHGLRPAHSLVPCSTANVKVVGTICPNVQETKAFLARARAAGWEMIPSHDPKPCEHRWYVQPAANEAAVMTEP
ncbi:MAG: hypothetical protein ACLQQM_05860, partial [Acidimicrobiales bacterium]